jgi:hypothetical protein
MSDSNGRLICPNCQAENFLSSELCWQCGKPLRTETTPPEGPTTPPAFGSQIPYPPPAPSEPPAPYPDTRRTDDSHTYVILGFVFAGIALLCCPVFAIAAIVMGAVAYSKGNQTGLWIIIIGVLELVGAGILSRVLRSSGMHGFGPMRPFPGPRNLP